MNSKGFTPHQSQQRTWLHFFLEAKPTFVFRYGITKTSTKIGAGFTLIEFMIVVALIIMFAGLTLPISFNFYQKSTLNDQARNLENSLKKAQAMAITGQGESNAGVYINQKEFMIFEGESSEKSRQASDTVIPFSAAVSVSINETDEGEIVFQKSTGLPIIPEEQPIVITLTFGANSQEININSQGKIERYEPKE